MEDLFAKKDNWIQKIELNEIIFFTKINNKVIAVSKDSSIELNTSLYSLSEILPKKGNFIRCHKSFIINIDKVERITKFNNKTFNISFKGSKEQAYITQQNLKILKNKILVI